MRHTAFSDQRKGIVLFSALVSLMIIAALGSAILFRARSDGIIANAMSLRQRALGAAEMALWTAVSGWRVEDLDTLTLNRTAKVVTQSGDLEAQILVTRVDTSIYWIVAQAEVERGRFNVRRRVALSATVEQREGDTVRMLMPLSERAWVNLY